MASSNPALLLRLVSASCVAARRAGDIIRDVMAKGELGIVDKATDPRMKDLQTEADRSAQRCIVQRLSQEFPQLTIIGEEDLEETSSTGDGAATNDAETDESVLNKQVPSHLASVTEDRIVVWVDPLDGTTEYTQGFVEHVTVLIGIAFDGAPIAGIIHQPFYKKDNEEEGRTVWGIVGLGAFGISGVTPPEGERIVTTTRSHGTGVVAEAVEACDPTTVLRVGGAGNKVLQLIDGKAHAYVFASPGCKKWDTCAPEAVLTAIGGKLTDIHGNPLRYDRDVNHRNSTGVLAAVKEHAFYLGRIPQKVKDALPS